MEINILVELHSRQLLFLSVIELPDIVSERHEETGDIALGISEDAVVSTPSVEVAEPSIELVRTNGNMAMPSIANSTIEKYAPEKVESPSMKLVSIEAAVGESTNILTQVCSGLLFYQSYIPTKFLSPYNKLVSSSLI
ncbi:unnamed protein product [Protopolystoma xenopodis]|uniref:Uncharacterized protein n=1 Tax=Protopolystoma xenopodis TaxID=117903 RepID=A0A448WWQ0_9PLAT|nr:unnamed protein product [Protopolystoma xenopodis]